MSPTAYEQLFAVVDRGDGRNRVQFDARWRAIATIIDESLWRHAEWRSESAFLRRGVGIAARKGRRLARIAARTSAWPYRNESLGKLETVARFHEEAARVGSEANAPPVARRDGRQLAGGTVENAERRDIKRATKTMRRMDDGALRHGELVVLLHGLGRTRLSMKKPERALQAAGFQTANMGYDSRKASVQSLAKKVWAAVRSYAAQFEQVHFLTHSLGGVLVRQLLNEGRVENVGRVVMLAPPNHGSEVVDRLRKVAVVPAVMGPAFLELGTGAQGPERLGPAKVPTAVIAARRSQWPFSLVFPGPNDGKVSVASARLDGMEAFLVVDETHTGIMRSPEVLAAVVGYLTTGELLSSEKREPISVRQFFRPSEG